MNLHESAHRTEWENRLRDVQAKAVKHGLLVRFESGKVMVDGFEKFWASCWTNNSWSKSNGQAPKYCAGVTPLYDTRFTALLKALEKVEKGIPPT